MVIAGVNVDHQHLIDLTKTFFVERKPVWYKEGQELESSDRSIAQYTGGIVKVLIADYQPSLRLLTTATPMKTTP